MRFLKRLLIGLGVIAIVVVAGGYRTYLYMNRTPAQLVAPNYYEYYKKQDTVPEGRVGIFISHLVMPADYRMEDFYLLALKARQYIHEWEEEHGGKHHKVIIAPQIGDFPVIRQTWVQMLKDRLDTLPPDAAVTVVTSTHGMAWRRVPNEAWIELARAYRDTTPADLKTLLESCPFPRTEIVLGQDHFADPINDPKSEYLSTNKAFHDGIRENFDYVINVPIEFFAEKTDTLFSHAMFNFEHIPDFDRYQQVDYPDWTVPFTREYVVDGTHLIYNGVPVGKYNGPIITAFVHSMDSVLAKGSGTPVARAN